MPRTTVLLMNYPALTYSVLSSKLLVMVGVEVCEVNYLNFREGMVNFLNFMSLPVC